MMGLPMPFEQMQQVTKAVEERKAAVAASLGKTAEELDREAHAAAAAAKIPPASNPEGEDEDDIDGERVLAFILNREKKIKSLEDQIRKLKLDNSRLTAQANLADRKVEALRAALATAREVIAELKTGEKTGQ